MKKTLLPFTLLLLYFGCSEPEQFEPDEAAEVRLKHFDRLELPAPDSSPATPAAADSSAAWRLYGTAVSHERQMQYYDALNVYGAVLDEDDRFAPAYHGIARVLMRLNLPYKALTAATRNFELSGSKGLAGYELARSHLDALQPREAIEAVRQAVSAGFSQPVAKLLEARAHYMEHHLEAASKALSWALSNTEESGDFFREAAAYFETAGLSDSAIALSRKSVEAYGNDMASLQDILQVPAERLPI